MKIRLFKPRYHVAVGGRRAPRGERLHMRGGSNASHRDVSLGRNGNHTQSLHCVGKPNRRRKTGEPCPENVAHTRLSCGCPSPFSIFFRVACIEPVVFSTVSSRTSLSADLTQKSVLFFAGVYANYKLFHTFVFCDYSPIIFSAKLLFFYSTNIRCFLQS
jgi:hypothetical protein